MKEVKEVQFQEIRFKHKAAAEHNKARLLFSAAVWEAREINYNQKYIFLFKLAKQFALFGFSEFGYPATSFSINLISREHV